MKFNFAGISDGSSNTKRCSKCKLYLKKSSFCKDKTRKDGLRSYCKDCSNKKSRQHYEENKEDRIKQVKNWQEDNKEHLQEYRDGRKEEAKRYNAQNKDKQRNKRLYNTYGITEKEYDDMVREQDNKCAICENPESKLNDNGYPMRLCVDHDHITGQVRGLLCNKCNLGIGYLRSDEGTDILLNAVCYIEIHNLDDEF